RALTETLSFSKDSTETTHRGRRLISRSLIGTFSSSESSNTNSSSISAPDAKRPWKPSGPWPRNDLHTDCSFRRLNDMAELKVQRAKPSVRLYNQKRNQWAITELDE